MMQIALFALLAWMPVVIILFATLPPRRAVIASFLGGWMFLPLLVLQIEGLPDIGKVSVTSLSVMLAIAAFDGKRLLAFRPHWLDLPIVVWLIVPFVSSVVNGRGMYDGASRSFAAILAWGVPYLAGRLYFTDLLAIRELAIGFFIAGLIYVPLCVWEVRMSPQLHAQLYGFRASGMLRGSSLGIPGYRPNVFIGHGLDLSIFMLTCTLSAIWLWKTRALRQLWGFPTGMLAFALYATTVLCKVFGTIILLHLAIAVLFSTKWLRTSIVVAVLAITPAAYMWARMTGAFTGETVLGFARLIEQGRADSLQFRLNAERGIIANAMEKPWFGYGSDPQWRLRLTEESLDEKRVVTDGMWIVALGQGGLVGLTALTLLLLLPPLMLWKRMPVPFWEHPAFAPIVAFGILMICFTIDSLFNASINVLTMLIAGSLCSMLPLLRYRGAAQASGRPAYSRPSRAQRPSRPARQPARPAYAS